MGPWSSGLPRVCSWSVCRRVNAAPTRKSNSILAATAFACLSSNSIGSRAALNTWLDDVSWTVAEGPNWRAKGDARSLSIAKPSPLDFNPSVTKASLVLDFGSDMLPFSIAISPDKQGFAVLSLFFNILGNTPFILPSISKRHQKINVRKLTYCINIFKDRHFEQQTRRARSPTFVFFAKL